MRLKSIKLAGFKSFVDPTTVSFPSNICAVVGPNGCGKSNIIDAVRWVMGESSAKQLRGEAMTDVIFNGSGARKPVGQASIELIFDNSDGTIVGEYAAYSEISVKRKVTRGDAQNTYYLNGNKCRRKDITDLFLGTGLGARSYAIIEQGMISNLVEAKPDELRTIIEEAAGISKYKERRRDTENRIHRTMENLERLRDIREELDRQLSRLERQAKAAEKYSKYKQQERWFRAQQLALQIQALQEKSAANKTTISDLELKVEAIVTEQVGKDTAIEKLRSQFTDLSDAFNEVQGRYYAAGTDIARIEQSIQHAQQRGNELQQDLNQCEKELTEAEAHLNSDQEKSQVWQAELAEIEPLLNEIQLAEQSSTEILLQAEEVMQNWQTEWDNFNQQAAVPQQTAEVQQSRIKHIEQVQVRLLERIEKLQEEQGQLAPEENDGAVTQLQTEISSAELELQSHREALTNTNEAIAQSREQMLGVQQQLDDQRSELQQQRGRFASLEALQQAAMSEDSVGPWLQQQGLDRNQRLADHIEVQPGWERALEIVLGNTLQAVCVNGFEQVIHRLDSLGQGSLTLLDQAGGGAIGSSASKADRLIDKVTSSYSLISFLDGIYVAEDMAQALQLRAQLSGSESVVTRDGFWLGQNWLRVYKQQDAQFGILERKQEIEALEQTIEKTSQQIQSLQQQQQQLQSRSNELEQQQSQLREQIEAVNKRISDRQSELSAHKVRIEEINNRRARAAAELQEAREQLDGEGNNLSEARAILADAIEKMQSDSSERERLMNLRDQHRQRLDQARQKARHDKDKSHELALRQQSLQTQADAIRESIERLQLQIRRQQERKKLLQSSYDELQDPLAENQDELAGLLEKRVTVEAELGEARQAMETVEQDLHDNEKHRNEIDQRLQSMRQKLEHERIEAQTYRVQLENNEQLLQQENYELQQVLAEMDADISQEDIRVELEKIANRITRLGPINLAAMDEYQVELERKTYLDSQHADLEEALTTLQDAIRKIDIETRNRFKETFESVNGGLQELFPKVFGGGSAYLELTGDDLLETGITIMARPPGKRNSTIHLLSGGEKALTAVALVFAIFRLNPAPFCMLDEVDAPLDDINVDRYARLLQDMSHSVQFIYITHNKISMEVANQLMGITMQEPGVSRLVSVDIDEAAELAAV